MKHQFKSAAIWLLLLLAGSSAHADTAIDQRLLDLDNKLLTLDAELTRTNLRIDGINNGVLLQVGLPIIIGLVTLVLARWDSKRQMKAISDQEIARWLQKEGHERWDQALEAYLKANFPGRIDYLLAAGKAIAYDQELQQTKRIRVIGIDSNLSQKIVAMLRERGFKQVEFVQYKTNMNLPPSEIVLVDRYSCIKAPNRLEEDDVKQLFNAAKAHSQGPFIHYFGATIQGLPLLMNERAALSSAEFSLVPNLMDQLRFAFPQPKS